MKIIISIILIFLLACSGSVAGDFNIGRSSGMAGNIVLSSPDALDRLECPSAIFNDRRLLLDIGYQRKFELSDLDKVYLATGYSRETWAVTAGFSQLGRADYYIEQAYRAALSYRYRYYILSLSISGKRWAIDAGDRGQNYNAISAGAALGVHYEKLHLAAACHNINRPKLHPDSPAERIKVDIFGEIEETSFSITGKMALEENEKPIISVGQSFWIQNKHGLFWGVQINPVSYGGGLSLALAGFDFIYAVAYHPVLGFTHNISIAFETTGNRK